MTVPASDRLRRPASAAEAFRRLRADRQRGARDLALEALDALSAELARWSRLRTAVGQHPAAQEIAAELARTQPAMGIFREWSREWVSIERGGVGRALRAPLEPWLRGWRTRLRREPARIGRTVAQNLPADARIVTISRGSTLARALIGLPPGRRPNEVVVLESRPGGEGREMARDLRRGGIRARWVRDGSVAKAVAGADLVLVGADTVECDGALVHKVGTRGLAAVAQRHRVPLVVVAGRSKWVQDRLPGRLPHDFDRTPATRITEYWTDEGVLPGRASGWSAQQREEPPPASRRGTVGTPGRRRAG